jgi:glycosyltransferase involved in cell wall biosynthesis
MNKVCVLIRVYNRVEDLKHCVNIIRDTWKGNDYHIIVVANGEEDGFAVDNETEGKIDLHIKIEKNTGHFSGNSQLLLAGIPHIPAGCDYSIILEADTWLHGDELINKYIARLKDSEAVWASAQFFRYVLNLATDFILVKTDFIKIHQQVFQFDKTPEYYVANYLRDNGFPFIYIKELMPVNMPRYIKKYPFAPTGRFFIFPEGKMVTHHIESLKNGMEDKQFYFNVAAGLSYFNVSDGRSITATRRRLKLAVMLTLLIPYKGWFIKQKTANT